jgi:2-methylcitrate dehydratase PrpD
MTTTTAPDTLTHYVARFIQEMTYQDIPVDVIALGKKSILDGLGLAFAGSVAESGRLVQAHLDSLNLGGGSATLIGGGRKIAPRFAAFANGVAIHADDYDDTQLAVAETRVYGLLTHPTAPSLPAALAMGEQLAASGQDVLLAYQLGVEVECKIAEAIDPRHYQTGFHTTATCGTFAAAAAASRLMGLDHDATTRALSVAGSQSAGLRENFGTMTKPFHAGRSAESGIIAAQLASSGWTATNKILESPRGFFHAAGGGYDESAIENRLGLPWTFTDPGISIKPHPSGSLTHPGMTEILRLIIENDIKPEQVQKVRVGTNSNMPNALIHHRPVDELQAKFSMEFCMAILLLERRAGLAEFANETVHRADVKEMIEKVDFVVDEEAERAGYDKMTTIIDIALHDGRIISGRADFGKGSPSNPMSYDDVAEKFRECADFSRIDNNRTSKIIAMVRDLESLSDIRKLSALLIAPG